MWEGIERLFFLCFLCRDFGSQTTHRCIHRYSPEVTPPLSSCTHTLSMTRQSLGARNQGSVSDFSIKGECWHQSFREAVFSSLADVPGNEEHALGAVSERL